MVWRFLFALYKEFFRMTTQPENVAQSGGTGGTPTQSNSPAGTPTSFDVDALVGAFKANPAFASLVKDLALPVAQSTKDRRIAKQEQRLDDFEQQLARFNELKAEGWNDAQAQRLMKLEASEPQPEGQNQAAPASSPGSGQQAPGVNTDLLSVLGLQINDPDVVETIRQGKLSDSDFISLAIGRKSRQVQPNPALVVPTGTGLQASGQDELETITAQLAEAMRNPTANFARIQELRQKSAALLTRK
jgi:hypothetical protein